MSAEARATLIVDVKTDTAQAGLASLGKAGTQAGKETKAGFGDAVQGLTGFNVASLAGVGAITAVGGALAYAIGQAAEAEKIMAQTEAVIKSTGGAAGLTAEEIEKMAGALSNQSTFADDAIQKGQNLLLTFVNIGKEVFPQASQAMVDMAVAMGTDVSGGAIALGKALNDPIRGVTSLTRVGVTFTEEQKQMIKALVETGDVAGAQTIIIQELNKEFGGSAAAQLDTYSGKIEHMKNSFDNVAEAVGGWVIPVLSGALDGLMNLWKTYGGIAIAAMQFTGVISDQEAVLRIEALAAGDLSAVFSDQVDVVEETIDAHNRAADATEQLAQKTDATTSKFAEFDVAAYGASRAAYELTRAETEAAKAAMELAAAESDLASIIGGELGNEMESFRDKQADITVAMGETQAKIDILNSKSYLTPAQRGELDGLTKTLGEQKQAYADNATAHEEATARIIFGFVQQRLAADGLQAGEIAMLGEIGKAWGIYDQATADALAAVDDALTTHGNNAKAVIDALGKSINDLPDSKDFYYNIHVNGQIPDGGVTDPDATVDYGNGDDDEYGDQRASGGQVFANRPTVVGEHGVPEWFVPSTSGYVYPSVPNAGNQSTTAGAEMLAGELRMLIGNLPRAIRDALQKA